MTIADHNRAVSLCADTVAKIAVRAAALACDSPAQRRRVLILLAEIAVELRTLTLKTGDVQ